MLYIISDDKYFRFIAKAIYDLLSRYYQCKLINEIEYNNSYNDNNLYMIFNIWAQKKPNLYILYNFEQLRVNYYDKKKYCKAVSDALLIIDYSKYNSKFWDDNKLDHIWLPYCLTDKDDILIDDKKIDILFVGTLNDRRKILLDKIDKKYNIVVLSDIFGEELEKYMKDSKICLNIHYYGENGILEVSRIIPMLKYKVKIITELSVDEYYNEQYSDLVEWYNYDEIMTNNRINELIEKVMEKNFSNNDKLDNYDKYLNKSIFDKYLIKKI